MSRISLRSKRTLLVVGVIALAVSGIAYAYWTTSGEGHGTGTAASGVTATDVSVNVADGIHPGGGAAVTGVVKNLNGDTSVHFTTIDDTSIAVDEPHATAGCLNTDFSFAPLTPAGGVTLTPSDGAAGGTDEYAYTGALAMANSAISQDACKGAAITVTLKAS